MPSVPISCLPESLRTAEFNLSVHHGVCVRIDSCSFRAAWLRPASGRGGDRRGRQGLVSSDVNRQPKFDIPKNTDTKLVLGISVPNFLVFSCYFIGITIYLMDLRTINAFWRFSTKIHISWSLFQRVLDSCRHIPILCVFSAAIT